MGVEMGRSRPDYLVLVAAALAACSAPEVTADDGHAVRVAAVSEIVRKIAENPGPIEAICVDFTNETAGESAIPGLDADLGLGDVELLPRADCEEIGGVLQKRGGGQAISVTPSTPALDGGNGARVQVLTSTGSRDVAAYACTLRRDGDVWLVKQCELEATT